MTFRILLLLSLTIFMPSAAAAYIGPGAGLSAIGTAVALVGAFVLLILGFVWYPVKRLLRRRQKGDAVTADGQSDENRS